MANDGVELQAVRRDIELTRARMAATAAELDDVVSTRVHAAKEAVDPGRMIADHPWPAVLLAVAAGIVLGTGGDRRAARATTRAASTAARELPGATKRGATAAAGAVAGAVRARFAGDGEEHEAPDGEAPAREARPGFVEGLAIRLGRALHAEELFAQMSAEADRIGSPRMRA